MKKIFNNTTLFITLLFTFICHLTLATRADIILYSKSKDNSLNLVAYEYMWAIILVGILLIVGIVKFILDIKKGKEKLSTTIVLTIGIVLLAILGFMINSAYKTVIKADASISKWLFEGFGNVTYILAYIIALAIAVLTIVAKIVGKKEINE